VLTGFTPEGRFITGSAPISILDPPVVAVGYAVRNHTGVGSSGAP